VKAADADISARIEAAEATLRTQQAEAVAGIEDVASEAVQEIVAKVAGLTVDKGAATTAVKAALAA
jgi:F-type H+-transporting ATPase subunit b